MMMMNQKTGLLSLAILLASLLLLGAGCLEGASLRLPPLSDLFKDSKLGSVPIDEHQRQLVTSMGDSYEFLSELDSRIAAITQQLGSSMPGAQEKNQLRVLAADYQAQLDRLHELNSELKLAVADGSASP